VPPPLTVGLMTVPLGPTFNVTPLLMVKPLSVYPKAISSVPPAPIVTVPLVIAPPRSSEVPPLRTAVSLAVPPDATSKVTPLLTVKPVRV
jgi:hypothetical protein